MQSWMCRNALSPLLVLGVGCSSSEKDSVAQVQEWVQLVSAEAWTEVVDPGSDPFEDRPEVVDCSSQGYGIEGTYFEVETDDCAYGTFQQALLHGVEAGEELRLVFWHLDLWATEPAQAHVAVALEDAILYELVLEIPGKSAVHAETFPAPRTLVAGETVFFHLHNHGYNSWSLGGLEGYTLP